MALGQGYSNTEERQECIKLSPSVAKLLMCQRKLTTHVTLTFGKRAAEADVKGKLI